MTLTRDPYSAAHPLDVEAQPMRTILYPTNTIPVALRACHRVYSVPGRRDVWVRRAPGYYSIVHFRLGGIDTALTLSKARERGKVARPMPFTAPDWQPIGFKLDEAEGDGIALWSPITGALRFAHEIDAGVGNYVFIDDGMPMPVHLHRTEATSKAQRLGYL